MNSISVGEQLTSQQCLLILRITGTLGRWVSWKSTGPASIRNGVYIARGHLESWGDMAATCIPSTKEGRYKKIHLGVA